MGSEFVYLSISLLNLCSRLFLSLFIMVSSCTYCPCSFCYGPGKNFIHNQYVCMYVSEKLNSYLNSIVGWHCMCVEILIQKLKIRNYWTWQYYNEMFQEFKNKSENIKSEFLVILLLLLYYPIQLMPRLQNQRKSMSWIKWIFTRNWVQFSS